jgi:hypothetical protein
MGGGPRTRGHGCGSGASILQAASAPGTFTIAKATEAGRSEQPIRGRVVDVRG